MDLGLSGRVAIVTGGASNIGRATSHELAKENAIVVIFDENAGASGNQVYCAVISPFTTPGTRSSTNFNHYSLLRTTEEILGVPLLGSASGAASMRAAFGL